MSLITERVSTFTRNLFFRYMNISLEVDIMKKFYGKYNLRCPMIIIYSAGKGVLFEINNPEIYNGIIRGQIRE